MDAKYTKVSLLVRTVLIVWAFFPYFVFWLLNRSEKHRSSIFQTTLHCVQVGILVIASGIYIFAIVFQPAISLFTFVFLPPVLLVLLIILTFGLAKTIRSRSDRLSEELSEKVMLTSRMGRIVKGVGKLLAFSATVFTIGFLTILLFLSVEHQTAIKLPQPTGSYSIGRSILALTDDSNALHSQQSKREVLVWIWYPAVSTTERPEAEDYFPSQIRTAIEQSRGWLISKLLTRDLSNVEVKSIRNARISAAHQQYPVVIMRAGASAEVANYTTLAEDLASNGYIVVGLDAPYRTNTVVFPDGRTVQRDPENDLETCLGKKQNPCVDHLLQGWTSDMSFVIDRLERINSSDSTNIFFGRVDLERIGVFGHSFGGAQAAQFCHDDSRCKAGVDIDGQLFGSVVQEGIDRPFMFLLSDHGKSSDQVSREIGTKIQSLYDHLPSNGRLLVSIKGANHFTFSDDGALLKSGLMRWFLRRSGGLAIDGDRQLAVTAYSLRTFFDHYLKDSDNSSNNALTFDTETYPELLVLTRESLVAENLGFKVIAGDIKKKLSSKEK
jgi:predicted dienelactone hydrolase